MCGTAGPSSRPLCAGAIVGLGLSVLGCNRYEYRTVQCPPVPRGIAASALGWEATPFRNTIVVRVRAAATGDTISSGLAAARVDGAPWKAEDPDGAVHLESVAPGRHVVVVRAFGRRIAVDTVLVQRDSGVAALAVMAAAPGRIDEACGWMRYRVRKPWWKLW